MADPAAVVLVANGVELDWGNNPIPRKGESVTLYSDDDMRRTGRVGWRVEDVFYLVREDDVRIRVVLG